jgi:hypothetical protein
MLVPLSDTPSRVYGNDTLHSKYVDDDGGPSYWWRDKVIARMLDSMGKRDLGRDMQERLLKRIGVPHDDVLERLERFVSTKPHNAFANVDELLTVFADREERQRIMDSVLRLSARGAFPIMLSVSLGALFAHPYSWLHAAIWALTLLSLPVSIVGFRTEPSEYLDKKELAKIERMRAAKS